MLASCSVKCTFFGIISTCCLQCVFLLVDISSTSENNSTSIYTIIMHSVMFPYSAKVHPGVVEVEFTSVLVDMLHFYIYTLQRVLPLPLPRPHHTKLCCLNSLYSGKKLKDIAMRIFCHVNCIYLTAYEK